MNKAEMTDDEVKERQCRRISAFVEQLNVGEALDEQHIGKVIPEAVNTLCKCSRSCSLYHFDNLQRELQVLRTRPDGIEVKGQWTCLLPPSSLLTRRAVILLVLFLIINSGLFIPYTEAKPSLSSTHAKCAIGNGKELAQTRMQQRQKRGAPPFPFSSALLSDPRGPLGQFLEGLADPFGSLHNNNRNQNYGPVVQQNGRRQESSQTVPNSPAPGVNRFLGQNQQGSAQPDTNILFRNLLQGIINKFGEDNQQPQPSSPSQVVGDSVDGVAQQVANAGAVASDGLNSGFELWAFDACTAEYSSMLLPSSDKSVSDNIHRYIMEVSNLTAKTREMLHRHAIRRCGFRNQTYDSWAATEVYERCLPRPLLATVKWGNKMREILKDAFVKIQVYTLAQKVTYDYFSTLSPGPNSTLRGNLRDITCNMQHLRDNIRDELLINHAFTVPVKTNMPFTTNQVVERCSVKGDPCVKALRMFHTTKTYVDALREAWVAERTGNTRQ